VRRGQREVEIAGDLLFESLGQEKAEQTALDGPERRLRDEEPVMQHDPAVEPLQRSECVCQEVAIRGRERAARVTDAVPAVV